jgi:hypothetical protein
MLEVRLHEHEQAEYLRSVQDEGIQLESCAQVFNLEARKRSQVSKRTPLLLCHVAVLRLRIKASKCEVSSLLFHPGQAVLKDWVAPAEARARWRARQMHELPVLPALCEAQ